MLFLSSAPSHFSETENSDELHPHILAKHRPHTMDRQQEQNWEWNSFLNNIKEGHTVCLSVSDRTSVWKHRHPRREVLSTNEKVEDLARALMESTSLRTLAITIGENLRANTGVLFPLYQIALGKPDMSVYIEVPNQWNEAQKHRLAEILQVSKLPQTVWINKMRFDSITDIQSFRQVLERAPLDGTTVNLESLFLSKECGEGNMDCLLDPFRNTSGRIEINIDFRSARARPTVFTTKGLCEYVSRQRYRKVFLQNFGLDDDHCKSLVNFLQTNRYFSDIDLRNNPKMTEKGIQSLYRFIRDCDYRSPIDVDDHEGRSTLRLAAQLNSNADFASSLRALFTSNLQFEKWLTQQTGGEAVVKTPILTDDERTTLLFSAISYNCGYLF